MPCVKNNISCKTFIMFEIKLINFDSSLVSYACLFSKAVSTLNPSLPVSARVSRVWRVSMFKLLHGLVHWALLGVPLTAINETVIGLCQF